MRNPALLGRLGVFVAPGFLSGPECEALVSALGVTATLAAGEVVRDGVLRVDRDVRRTEEAQLEDALRSEVQRRLDEVRPALEAFFARPLEASEGVAFLIYETGGFYRPHRDRSPLDAGAGGNETHRRQVSAVIFLNRGESTPPADYAGGRLTLFGLIDDDRSREIGIPIHSEPGLLVAFRSDLVHEVTPVSSGRRMTAVDWFY